MPRGSAQNPFCLFAGTITIPTIQRGDWIEILDNKSPRPRNAQDLTGEQASVYVAYSDKDILVRTPDYRINTRLSWNKGDRWKKISPPKQAKA